MEKLDKIACVVVAAIFSYFGCAIGEAYKTISVRKECLSTEKFVSGDMVFECKFKEPKK